jgi:hypothetical protein
MLQIYAGFIFIPQDQTVCVWAEFDGCDLKPGEGRKIWTNGEFAWLHYGQHEFVMLNFTGISRSAGLGNKTGIRKRESL